MRLLYHQNNDLKIIEKGLPSNVGKPFYINKNKLVVVGVGHVAFSMPCIIGREGILKQLPVVLNEWETQKLEESVVFIKSAMRDAKTGPGFEK